MYHRVVCTLSKSHNVSIWNVCFKDRMDVMCESLAVLCVIMVLDGKGHTSSGLTAGLQMHACWFWVVSRLSEPHCFSLSYFITVLFACKVGCLVFFHLPEGSPLVSQTQNLATTQYLVTNYFFLDWASVSGTIKLHIRANWDGVCWVVFETQSK